MPRAHEVYPGCHLGIVDAISFPLLCSWQRRVSTSPTISCSMCNSHVDDAVDDGNGGDAATSPPVRSLKHCSQCKQVCYCSTSCQKAHWKEHKPACKPAVELLGLPFLLMLRGGNFTYQALLNHAVNRATQLGTVHEVPDCQRFSMRNWIASNFLLLSFFNWVRAFLIVHMIHWETDNLSVHKAQFTSRLKTLVG